MKRIFTFSFSLLMSAIGLNAFAASMGEATTTMPLDGYASSTVLEGGYYSYPSTMIITWNNQPVKFADNIDESSIFFTVTNLTDSEQENETRKGKTNLHPGTGYQEQSESEFVYLSLGYNFNNDCEYQVTLPAGIFQNEEGDTNLEQNFTFHVCKNTISYYDATVSPKETNNQSPVFYTAEQLNDVTITWEGVPFEKTGIGKILAYKSETVDYVTTYTYVDLTDKTSFSDGVLHIDASDLPDSLWYLYITEGYFKCTIDGVLKINYQVSLSYLIETPEPFVESDFQVTNPLDGSLVTQISSVSVSFGQPIKLVENGPSVSCVKENTSIETTLKIDYSSGNYGMTIVLPSVLQEPGVYHFTIPEGVVTNGTYTNQKHEFDVRVTPYYNDFEMNPQGGMVTSSQMNDIVIEFPGIEKIEIRESATPIYYMNSSYQQTNLSFEDNVKIEGNEVHISIPELEPGTYTLYINPFIFLLDGIYVNPYIYQSFTVWNGMPEAKVIEAPQEYGNAGTDSLILLEWEGQAVTPTEEFKVQYKYYNQSYLETTVDLSNACYELVNIQNPQSSEYNGLSIDLGAVYEEFMANEGKNTSPYYAYTITIVVPQGIVKNSEGLVNSGQSFRFNLYDYINDSAELMTTETDGVYAIVWPDVTQLSVTYGYSMTLTNSAGEATLITCPNTYNFGEPEPGYFSAAYLDPDNFKGLCLMVNVNGMADGEYTLSVPEGIVTLNQNDNTYDVFINRTVNFTLAIGESSIVRNEKIENGYKVFTLQGVKVLDTNNIEDLNRLSNGIYIINGKKTLIRK